jgi:hypothetical protein
VLTKTVENHDDGIAEFLKFAVFGESFQNEICFARTELPIDTELFK